jgi:hypothetical protein
MVQLARLHHGKAQLVSQLLSSVLPPGFSLLKSFSTTLLKRSHGAFSRLSADWEHLPKVTFSKSQRQQPLSIVLQLDDSEWQNCDFIFANPTAKALLIPGFQTSFRIAYFNP